MSTATQKMLTAEEFINLPNPADGSQQELIKGVVITMPVPKPLHGFCCSKIDRRLGTFIEANDLGMVLCNDAGFIVARNPDSVRGPDVAYWQKDRAPDLLSGEYAKEAPDLAVEVISPDDSASRLNQKIVQYFGSGVEMIWLVDPEIRIVTVYRANQPMRVLENGDTLSGEDVVPGFSCSVTELFP